MYNIDLYEGLAFGLNTFIIYGFKKIKSIVSESESLFYVEKAKDIYNVIVSGKLSNVKDNIYWKKVACNYILNIIDEIIKSK